MHRMTTVILACALLLAAASEQTAGSQQPGKTWVERSNNYTNMFLEVEFAHAPERGSRQGLARYDERISHPTLADERERRRELEATLARVDAAAPREADKKVQQDLAILHQAFDLRFRQDDYRLQHEVPFLNASAEVFEGLHVLLDDQVAPERRGAALSRLRRYAGVESGYEPYTEVLKQREREQIAKPGVIYPSRTELETELGRNSNYIEGIAALLGKYGLKDWESAYQKLKSELSDYDTWMRENILPKARSDYRLPAEKYALAFEEYGIDLPPPQIASMAHAAFSQYQSEMAPLAAQVARAHGYPSGW
jgi:uncharacterized protein DUF885